MLKLKLYYFGHLIRRANSLEKTLFARKDGEGQEEKGATDSEAAHSFFATTLPTYSAHFTE